MPHTNPLHSLHFVAVRLRSEGRGQEEEEQEEQQEEKEAALPAEIRQRWSYDPATSGGWVAKDRSSIYGGFHLYELNA